MLNTPDNPLTWNQAKKLRAETGSTETQYYGSACKKCSSAVRWVTSGGRCVKCLAACQKDYHAKNRDSRRTKMAAYNANNRVALAAKRAAYYAELITQPTPCCGAMLTAPRSTHKNLACPTSSQKYCKHCRPEYLASVQLDAPCFIYVAELDGRHGPITGFGIADNPSRRWQEHRANLRDEGMHIVGDVWVSRQMTRAEALDIESMLKAFSDPCPIPGFKTESLRGHHAAGLMSFIQS